MTRIAKYGVSVGTLPPDFCAKISIAITIDATMQVTQQDLDSFHRFAQQKLQNGGAESIEELFDLWRIEQPSPEDENEIHAIIRQGLADIKAGRGRPAEDVISDLRRKYNLPAE